MDNKNKFKQIREESMSHNFYRFNTQLSCCTLSLHLNKD